MGEYTEGDAGNGWDAPFTERRADSVEESNCRPFFYDEDRPCSANGVMPYEEQFALNYTTIDRGFYWGTENETLANTEISYIRLFVTTIYL